MKTQKKLCRNIKIKVVKQLQRYKIFELFQYVHTLQDVAHL